MSAVIGCEREDGGVIGCGLTSITRVNFVSAAFTLIDSAVQIVDRDKPAAHRGRIEHTVLRESEVLPITGPEAGLVLRWCGADASSLLFFLTRCRRFVRRAASRQARPFPPGPDFDENPSRQRTSGLIARQS